MTLKDKLMTLQGPAMIVFSMCIIGAAGLVQHARQGQGVTQDMTQTLASQDCMADGFDTPAGRVGCLTPVILELAD